jgi:electron transport complex protein RnfC
MKSFARGIFLDEKKEATEKKPIAVAAIPQRVTIPLQQNQGCALEPIVKIGDIVSFGQKIADASRQLAVPLHASISGIVKKIEKLPNPCGFDVGSMVIEGDEKVVSSKLKVESRNLGQLMPTDIINIVREAGIVGLSGSTFPTHVKLSPPSDKKIDTVIINGCECEPYATGDHRLMLEKADELIFGAQAIAKAVGASRIIIGVEDNKQDAITAIKSEILNSASTVLGTSKLETNPKLEIQILKTKYPQGGEKMLIKVLLGREVPSRGLPLDVGAVVNNVGTVVACAEAIKYGKPLIERVVTVAGSGVREPKNLLVRLGTTFQAVFDECGGLSDDVVRVIMGGPMTGIAVGTLDLPVVKATNCLLALTRKDVGANTEGSCIRCGRCIKACPMKLTPNFLSDYAKLGDWERMEEYNLADCIECGCCSYVCPSKIFLVQYFKVGKRQLQIRKAVCR